MQWWDELCKVGQRWDEESDGLMSPMQGHASKHLQRRTRGGSRCQEGRLGKGARCAKAGELDVLAV